jgi:hypothetical protein
MGDGGLGAPDGAGSAGQGGGEMVDTRCSTSVHTSRRTRRPCPGRVVAPHRLGLLGCDCKLSSLPSTVQIAVHRDLCDTLPSNPPLCQPSPPLPSDTHVCLGLSFVCHHAVRGELAGSPAHRPGGQGSAGEGLQGKIVGPASRHVTSCHVVSRVDPAGAWRPAWGAAGALDGRRGWRQ